MVDFNKLLAQSPEDSRARIAVLDAEYQRKLEQDTIERRSMVCELTAPGVFDMLAEREQAFVLDMQRKDQRSGSAAFADGLATLSDSQVAFLKGLHKRAAHAEPQSRAARYRMVER